ncbi:ATP-binding cassette domain-containing protein [thermophilic bacterium 2918]|uniref:ATP-binding cassette domain-containing protein n=1 Tax=Thermogemmata fonticola TaxID=2755323 RepID=A0A7V9AB36_9BACT|nr:ATP-binding cassette domain-containing protein [Thermogemmata fonticola]
MRVGEERKSIRSSSSEGVLALSEPAPPASEIVVRVEHLSHAYRPSGWVLKDISFQVQAGECVAVVGPNGAGKTTLFLRLAGLLPGEGGQVNVCGWDPADPHQRAQLPSVLGMVFQNPEDQLFAPSVLEDVAFGPLNLGLSPDEAQERALTALASVGFPADKVHAPPFQLSGGDKRRAALAGVLAMQPKVWLLDEPTAFLDPRGRRELLALLRTLPGAKLIATHDLDFVLELCSRVLLLDGGQLMADGPIEEIFADDELLERHGLEIPCRRRWFQSTSMTADGTKTGASLRRSQTTASRSEEH